MSARTAPGSTRRRRPGGTSTTDDLLFERYRLAERLGAGGTAEVWRAHDTVLERPVALKRLHGHLLPDEAARERFASEARAAAGLSHPGIVTVHDVHVDDEGAAIVLELVDGEPLADRLTRGGALPPDEARAIAADVADALAYAHRRGIVHRDVKPGNIILERDGRARLVDFGIARLLDDAASGLTATGTVMGTLRYMAPEQLRGEPATPATDVFGLGAVLHEMLAGRPPFDAPGPAALVEAQAAGPPTIPGAPEELVAIARDALAHDPAARPPDGEAVASRLRSDEVAAAAAAAGAVAAASESAATEVFPVVAATPAMTVGPPTAAVPAGWGGPARDAPARGGDGDRDGGDLVAAGTAALVAAGTALGSAVASAREDLARSVNEAGVDRRLVMSGPRLGVAGAALLGLVVLAAAGGLFDGGRAEPAAGANPSPSAEPTPRPTQARSEGQGKGKGEGSEGRGKGKGHDEDEGDD